MSLEDIPDGLRLCRASGWNQVEEDWRVFLTSPGIDEKQLSAQQGQPAYHRYRGLHLLIQGSDRLFLVPSAWSASDSTLVVPLDEPVRLQFRFRNLPP